MSGSRDKCGGLTAKVEHVFALLPDLSDPTRWQPKLHDSYFINTVDGRTMPFTWRETSFDHLFWALGNCFPTPHEADQARDALYALAMDLHHRSLGSAARHGPGDASPRMARPRGGVVTAPNARRRVARLR